MLKPEDCKPGVLVECIAADMWGELTLRAVYTVAGLSQCFCNGLAVLVHEARGGSLCSGFALRHFRLVPGDRLDVFRHALEGITEEV